MKVLKILKLYESLDIVVIYQEILCLISNFLINIFSENSIYKEYSPMIKETSTSSLYRTPLSSQIQSVYKINRKENKENETPNEWQSTWKNIQSQSSSSFKKGYKNKNKKHNFKEYIEADLSIILY